ncbi:flagellin [Desulfosarcina ovata]|uniref:Flagellin n=1 Tax=Desulfosarcina ovata subsp. ovata TaxID=2752305 RepID=A0A5K8A715_9BACT|nr:flagellin [Desulfosarcina ovata]BBO88307.1 flagellin [Desulfosarcina ovata subsp. ovata]
MTIALTSGMRQNLTALQQVDSLMETTQNRLSTGKKVNSALDDPVNFFKAEDHYNRASDLEAKKDGMSEAIQTIEAANTGIEEIENLLDQMKSLASAAKTSDNDTDLEEQYNKLLVQVGEMAEDSSYGGQNLIQGTSNGISVEFNEDGTNTLSVSGFNIAYDSGSKAITMTGSGAGASAITISEANFDSNASIESAIGEIDSVIGQLRTEAQKLSSSLSTISIRSDFTSSMINTLETGGDNLTLADMNEEGANMLMLQTRQNLGTTSLSLASQAAQSVLQLF